MIRWLWPVVALCLAGWALWVLETARSGVTIDHTVVNDTPVTRYHTATAGPAVVIAHGFAGSRQMMQGYALPLAQAGYSVYSFDFEGHGAHPRPMSGDVNSLDGTTAKLIAQTRQVIDHAASGSAQPVALVGHSMATDVLVRTAMQDPRVGPLVLLSAYSAAIDSRHPANMLLVTGAWEPGLTDFAMRALQMVDPAAQAGETVTADNVVRRTVLAPMADHVSILHSRVGRQETVAWLNTAYNWVGSAQTPPTGWALIALLAAITALTPLLARLFPLHANQPAPLNVWQVLTVSLVPMIAAPILAASFDTSFLPVLVADYLALHLLIYGALQLGLLVWLGRRPAGVNPLAILCLLIWAIGAFGLTLDRYGANFWPTDARVPIIAALAVGALPFMLGDALAAHGAALWQRIATRIAFLGSLAIAVALDFEGLFFLIMIAPVIVLFYLTFGLMGRAFGARIGPATPGIALGLVLAWALGVSFPLFSA